MEESHAAQLEGINGQVSELNIDLHKRNLTIASLSERTASTDRELRDHTEALDRKHAEVQVRNVLYLCYGTSVSCSLSALVQVYPVLYYGTSISCSLSAMVQVYPALSAIVQVYPVLYLCYGTSISYSLSAMVQSISSSLYAMVQVYHVLSLLW